MRGDCARGNFACDVGGNSMDLVYESVHVRTLFGGTSHLRIPSDRVACKASAGYVDEFSVDP